MSLSLKPLFKAENRYQTILAALFVVYLMSNKVLPPPLMKLIRTEFGVATVVLVALTVFFHTHTIVGVLALLVAYEMIRTAGNPPSAAVYGSVQPSYASRSEKLKHIQPSFRTSLEEETVRNMMPYALPSSTRPDYLPVMDSAGDAAPARS